MDIVKYYKKFLIQNTFPDKNLIKNIYVAVDTLLEHEIDLNFKNIM